MIRFNSLLIGNRCVTWLEDDWYISRLQEVPGVFSQGATLKELEDNIRDAYAMMLEQENQPHPGSRIKAIRDEG